MKQARRWTLWALAALALAGVTAALGQEAKEFAPAVAPKEQQITLLQLFIVGGWCMWPLLALSIAGVTLVVRNYLAVKPARLLRPDLVSALRRQLAAREVFAARDVCRSNPTLVTALMGAGLERITSDTINLASVKEAIDESAAEQVGVYMRPITGLSVIGTVSPMVGLLGTVSGMIKAFQNMSSGGMGKPEMLAGNIGEALITTAAGLIIAIPVMIGYFYFKYSFSQSMASAGRIIGVLMNTLATGEMTYLSHETPEAAPAGAGAAAPAAEAAAEEEPPVDKAP